MLRPGVNRGFAACLNTALLPAPVRLVLSLLRKADNTACLPPLEQRRDQVGGLDSGACARRVNAGLFSAPEDQALLFRARVEQSLHGAAREVPAGP
jgi:hypothetical protein